jgi:hypothetical protein
VGSFGDPGFGIFVTKNGLKSPSDLIKFTKKESQFKTALNMKSATKFSTNYN